MSPRPVRDERPDTGQDREAVLLEAPAGRYERPYRPAPEQELPPPGLHGVLLPGRREAPQVHADEQPRRRVGHVLDHGQALGEVLVDRAEVEGGDAGAAEGFDLGGELVAADHALACARAAEQIQPRGVRLVPPRPADHPGDVDERVLWVAQGHAERHRRPGAAGEQPFDTQQRRDQKQRGDHEDERVAVTESTTETAHQDPVLRMPSAYNRARRSASPACQMARPGGSRCERSRKYSLGISTSRLKSR